VISDIRVGITVRRPRPEVAAVMFDVHFLPGWLSAVRNVEILAGQPPKEGARLALIGGRAAARPDEVFEVVEYQPDLTLVLKGPSKTLTLSLEGVPVGTVAWLEFQTERTGLRRLLWLFADHRERRIAIRDLRRLKQFIESGEYRTWFLEAEAED
jgi:hypothetical protein